MKEPEETTNHAARAPDAPRADGGGRGASSLPGDVLAAHAYGSRSGGVMVLELQQYRRRDAVELSEEQRDSLLRLLPSMFVALSLEKENHYDLVSGSWIGSLQLPGLEVAIRPKFPMEKVLLRPLLHYHVHVLQIARGFSGSASRASATRSAKDSDDPPVRGPALGVGRRIVMRRCVSLLSPHVSVVEVEIPCHAECDADNSIYVTRVDTKR